MRTLHLFAANLESLNNNAGKLTLLTSKSYTFILSLKNSNCTYEFSNIFDRIAFPRIILNKELYFALKSPGYRLYTVLSQTHARQTSARAFSILLYLLRSLYVRRIKIQHRMYVRNHNVTTNTNTWRTKSTDIYKTRLDSYNQVNVRTKLLIKYYTYQYEE